MNARPDADREAAAAVRRMEAEIFGRRSEGRIDPTNERMQALLDVLGEPQRSYRAIHLTGTNGKTSTARMVDELVRALGPRTGRYTSPHLSRVNERIVLDGSPVSDEVLAEAYAQLKPYVDLVDARNAVALSFFEIMTALAFSIFADAPVEIAVVEVGVGGTWDNTNTIDGDVAVITPIALDHMEYLGPDVRSIATEKAGIIKPGATAVLSRQPDDAVEPLLRRAVEVDAAVAREGLEFGVLDRRPAVGGQQLRLQGLGGEYDEIFLPLLGAHQAQNAVLALAAVEAFFGAGRATGPLDLESVREAFARVSSPGRLEIVRQAPTVLVDAAHNPAGMTATVEALEQEFSFRRLIGVVGVLGSKDARGLLHALDPAVEEVVVTQSSSDRALPVDELALIAVDVLGEDRVTVEPALDNAIETAVRLAEDDPDGVLAGAGVIVTGSVVTAGEARTLLGADRQ